MGSRPVWLGCISIKTCVCLLTRVLRRSVPFTGIHNGAFMTHTFLQELKYPWSFAPGTPCPKCASSPQPGGGFQGSGPQPEQCRNKGLEVQTCSCVGSFPSGTSGVFSNRLRIKGASDTWSPSPHKAVRHNICLEGQALPSLCCWAGAIRGHCTCPHRCRPPLDQGLAMQHLLQPPGNGSINWCLPAEHWTRKTSLSHSSVLCTDSLHVTRPANHHCTACPPLSGEVISKKGQSSIPNFLVNIRRLRERLIKKSLVTSTSLFSHYSQGAFYFGYRLWD